MQKKNDKFFNKKKRNLYLAIDLQNVKEHAPVYFEV
jgi:hypothetical protein